MSLTRRPVARRSFLSLSALTLGGAAALTLPSVTRSRRAAADDADLTFAVVTDTHANAESPERLAGLTRAFAAIEVEDPAFVLNCGDITDYGAEDEFAAYRAAIPDALIDRIHHVPGNHEVRWDPTAMENYRRHFGPPSYSFDADGLHFVALDPTQALQEPGVFGPDRLDWLRDDLERAGASTPSVLFLHLPFGGPYYYVNDTEDLLETIAPFRVRGIFAGHIHKEEVTQFNGLTEFAGVATKDGPSYYLVQRRQTPDGPVLNVTNVTLAEEPDAPATRRPAGVIPLGPQGPGSGVGPLSVGVDTRHDQFVLSVAAGSKATQVSAQVYPQGVFGGADAGTWVPLRPAGRGWRGTLDAAALPAGLHRLQVRAADDADVRWDDTVTVRRDGAGAAGQQRWTRSLGGQIQGALAERDGLVIAASTSGQLGAFRVDDGEPAEEWTRTLGSMHRGPAFGTDGAVVYVTSADHHLYAVEAMTGQTRWDADLGVPALSSAYVTTIGGAERVLATAGDTLFAITAEGEEVWRAHVPFMSAGRPISDGVRVFAGAGDGRGYAFDAESGDQVWSFATNTRADRYQRLLYGPWDDTVELLPDGAVLISSVSGAWALDPETGAQRWTKEGSYVYTPVLTTGDRLLMIQELGLTSLVDPTTGDEDWSVETAPRVLNAGPVLSEDESTAWIVGTTGLLVRVDLATGTARRERQLFSANTFSTPVRVGDTLVVGAQDGVLRGVALPETGH